MTLTSSKVRDFLYKEFFEMGNLGAYAREYGRMYGDGPVRYFYSTYSSWKSGNTSMSWQTQCRLLQVMPKILSDEKKFYVLSLYLEAAIEAHKKSWQIKSMKLSDLASKTEDCIEKVSNESYELDWFASGVYSSDDLKAFSGLVQWSIIEFAIKTYEWTFLDLRALDSALQQRSDAVKIKYILRLFNAELIVDMPIQRTLNIRIENINVTTEGKLKEQFRRALIDRGVEVFDRDTRSSHHRDRLVLDLNEIIKKSRMVLDTVQYEFKLKGELGTADVELVIYRKDKLKLLIGIYSLVGLVLFLVVGGLTALYWMYDRQMDIGGAVCPGLIVLANSGMILSKALALGKELKEYERERQTRP